MSQSFEPVEFLDVAIEICTKARALSYPSEPWVRTAAGRAYYGLYLIVRSAIADRHNISQRRLNHGAVCSHLQNSRLSHDVRAVGRHLEYLYALRRRADYELLPERHWQVRLSDPNAVMALTLEADRLARTVPHLDFTPIAHLF
ncbi:MAG TPA: hypothetical protein VF092_07700 [Longimicrobium sp.]